MNKIAFVYGEMLIYWSSIVMAMAVFTGILLFWATYLRSEENFLGAAVLCPAAILLSLLLARLIHWYGRADSYESLLEALTDFSGTGYALSGAFFGCLLAAWILNRLKIVKNLPLTLDCMSIGGCAAIAVGRLSCFFTPDNRGDTLTNTEKLPWVYPVVNTTSGMTEYRFATFLFQAVIAAGIFVFLLVLFMSNTSKKRYRDGDVTLLFLLLYCASQIVMDSTRYDSLRLRNNGFISIVQVFSAIALAAIIAVFSIRLWKKRGWKLWYVPIWIAAALCMGGAAYMEYHVQRHGNQAIFAYSGMSMCLLGIVAQGFVLWRLSGKTANPEKKLKGSFSR